MVSALETRSGSKDKILQEYEADIETLVRLAYPDAPNNLGVILLMLF